MGTVHEFPEGLRREDWPAEYVQREIDEDLEREETIGIAREVATILFGAIVGLIVVTFAIAVLATWLARYDPAPRPDIVAAETPVNP